MMRPPLSDVTRDDDLLIPVEGETVAATRFSPADREEPLPAILIYTPYRKDDLSGLKDDTMIQYFAGAGYHVVNADIVGTGASSGVKLEPFQEREGREAAALVNWLADQPWTTGRIGMTGMSYPGMTSLRGAIEDPDPLAAIVPVMAPFSMYERADIVSDSHFSGGTLAYQGGAAWLPLLHTLQLLPPSRRDDSGRWADIWRNRLDTMETVDPWLFQYLDHESPKDEYWHDKEIKPEAIEQIDVPTFLVDGWRDSFLHANAQYFDLFDEPKRLLVGPWRHMRPQQGRETRVDFRAQVVEWFDRFLKDVDNDALDRPRVTFWTERHGGGIESGIWRGGDRWPPEKSSERKFLLSADGLLRGGSTTVDSFRSEYEADHTVGLDSTVRYGPPRDPASDDARSLCFETTVDEPFECTGPGQASLQIVPKTSDPLIAVRLVDVSPDGSASLVTYGSVRGSHENGHSNPQPLTPDDPTNLRVPLKPTSHVFEAGHRIRLGVSAALFPISLPPREAGGFMLRSTPEASSIVTLQGRDHAGDVTFDDETSMGEFDGRIPAVSPSVRTTSSLETSREHLEDTGTFCETAETTYDLPNGGTMNHEQETVGTVTADNPLSATLRSENHIHLDYGIEQITAVQTSRVTRDMSRISVRITVNGEPMFDKTWYR